MTFKELRLNNPIHFLDKGEGMKYYQGKVVNVGQPRFDSQLPQPGAMPTTQLPQMVVDVTVEANGKTETYKFPDGASVAAVGSVLISTDKDGILREVDATIVDCEQYFASYDSRKKTYEASKALKAELDTAFKEKQETENRFNTIEKTQEEQGAKLDRILKLLEKGGK